MPETSSLSLFFFLISLLNLNINFFFLQNSISLTNQYFHPKFCCLTCSQILGTLQPYQPHHLWEIATSRPSTQHPTLGSSKSTTPLPDRSVPCTNRQDVEDLVYGKSPSLCDSSGSAEHGPELTPSRSSSSRRMRTRTQLQAQERRKSPRLSCVCRKVFKSYPVFPRHPWRFFV